MKTTNKTIKEMVDFNRNYIADLAIKGAKIKNCGKMCSSCAFKKDSEANMEPMNVNAAIDSLEIGQFNCHVVTGIDSGEPCKGFMNAMQVIDPDRKLRVYTPKNVCQCPHCDKKHGDNGKYLKAIEKNKSGLTKVKCECGRKFFVFYNYMSQLESMEIVRMPRGICEVIGELYSNDVLF